MRAVFVWDSGWITFWRDGSQRHYPPRAYPGGWTRRGKMLTLLKRWGWTRYPLRTTEAKGYEYQETENGA